MNEREFRLRIQRLVAIGALTLASVWPAASQAQSPNARAILPGYDAPILLDTLGIALPISGSRDSIFSALTAVLAELKIPIEERDPRTGMLRNLNAQLSRRLDKVPLSRYIDCGRGFSGNNADIYRVTLALSAWIVPATGEPQKLQVAIAASGRDPGGTNTGYSACSTRGSLEALIVERVRARLGLS
ncbi:MAG: hypothetical protein ABIZ91_05120 [Gemmatimonadaceae bacterium]